MDKLASFLDKYLRLTPPDEAIRQAVATAIKTVAAIELKKGAVRVKHFTVYLQIGPTAKSAIMIHREEILARLCEQFGTKAPREIK